MAMRRSPIIGIFDDTGTAEKALDALKGAGFSNDEIRYSGAAKGGFLGNLKNWFSGDEAMTGDVAKDLMNMGVTNDEANYYAQEYDAGHPIVAIKSTSREQEAMNILRSNGGYYYGTSPGSAANRSPYPGKTTDDASMRTQSADTEPAGTHSHSGDTMRPDMDAQAANAPLTDSYGRPVETTRPDEQPMHGDAESDQVHSMRLREEQLQMEKQRVQSGEVNIHKEVVTEQKSIDVPVSREEIVVERRPVTGGQPSNEPIGQSETYRMPVSEEQVNVTKTPIETGEVEIRKRTVQDTQHVSDTVRREEPRIESSGDATILNENDAMRREESRDVNRGDSNLNEGEEHNR